MQNVIVTGAAGFLGSHLSFYHLNVGDFVIGIDDFSSSKKDSWHILELKKHPNFELISEPIENIDWIVQLSLLKRRRRKFKIDLIYNFACPASPPRYQQIPIKTMVTCFLGTKNVLDYAMTEKARVVHASTSEVYGDPTVSPQPESYRGNVNTWGDRANYDVGKRSAEALSYEYLKLGVDVRLVRIFNTYGRYMDPDDGRVVTNFVKQGLKNENLTIYGDGNQTRSFCHVEDLTDGIIKLANLDKNPCMPINLGNPNEYKVIDLAKIVLDLIPESQSMFEYKQLPMDDPLQRKPVINKAKEILNWQPKIDVTDGISDMIAYMKEIL